MVKSRGFFVRTGKSPKIIHIVANCSHKGAIGHMKKRGDPFPGVSSFFIIKE